MGRSDESLVRRDRGALYFHNSGWWEPQPRCTFVRFRAIRITASAYNWPTSINLGAARRLFSSPSEFGEAKEQLEDVDGSSAVLLIRRMRLLRQGVSRTLSCGVRCGVARCQKANRSRTKATGTTVGGDSGSSGRCSRADYSTEQENYC